MQRNFFLTDLMGTGDPEVYDSFFNGNTLTDQHIDTCNGYFALHLYDLDSYDRRFAIIDRKLNSLIVADEYKKELDRRIELLHSQGFKFILATPWESLENCNSGFIYPRNIENSMQWTGGTSWFWNLMYHMHKDKKYNFNHNEKPYDFFYLNKMARTHRTKLYTKMRDEKLLDNSLHSNLQATTPTRLPPEYELPWVDADNYPEYGSDQDIFEKPYNHTKFNLISETNDNAREVFITEKLWKPIIAQQIFVVHGNHLYLQELRDMGFKTFNNYFDESYDLENDSDLKVDKIYKLCKDLLSKDWKDLYLQTQSLRQHNYNTFMDKEKLAVQINKVLLGFFEFFDSSEITS